MRLRLCPGSFRLSPAAISAGAGLALALTLLSLVLYALNPNTPLGPRRAVLGFLAFFAVTFTVAGLLIASRQPRNLIGWLFGMGGLAAALQCSDFFLHGLY